MAKKQKLRIGFDLTQDQAKTILETAGVYVEYKRCLSLPIISNRYRDLLEYYHSTPVRRFSPLSNSKIKFFKSEDEFREVFINFLTQELVSVLIKNSFCKRKTSVKIPEFAEQHLEYMCEHYMHILRESRIENGFEV